MGGMMSTRWNGHTKRDTVEDGRTLDLGEMARKGYFVPWFTGSCKWFRGETESASISYQVCPENDDLVLVLMYKLTKTQQEVNIRIPLETTRPQFGGVRWWGRCLCGRRVAKLYLAPGAVRFACRTCHGLTYESVQTHDKRVDALRRNPAELYRILDDSKAHLHGTQLLLALKALR